MIEVIKYKKIFISIALILLLASVLVLGVYGLRRGIDFTGGTLWQLSFKTQVEQVELSDFFKSELGSKEAIVNKSDSDGSFHIRLKEMSETDHQKFADELRSKFGEFEELSFQSIGAVVGKELVRKAIWAVIINLFAIVLYVAYAFRKVSLPVSSWKYSAITLLTLFHDAIIPLGLFAVLGKFYGVEIDTNFIVATLVVMGFSVHDTIVVFDRIRENLGHRSGGSFPELVNRSVNETMARSINTSLTLVVVLFALYLLGAASLNNFILVILLGTILGTYSSIFVASPLLVAWNKKSR